MEESTNRSRLSVLFGDDIGSNQQSSFNLNLTINKQKAQAQAAKVKELVLNQAETASSLVFVLPCQDENREKLVKQIEGLLNNTTPTKVSKDASSLFKAGKMSFKIVENQDKVILVLLPAGEFAEMIFGQLNFILGAQGTGEVLENQENSIALSLRSANTFFDLEEFIKGGDSFISALLKSLKIDLTVDIHQNLFTAILEILSSIDSSFENSPLGFLQFFKNFNIDVKFASSDELPADVRSKLFSTGLLAKGFRLPKSESEADKKFYLEFLDLIEQGVEIFLTVEDVLALHVETNIPGFKAHVCRDITPQ